VTAPGGEEPPVDEPVVGEPRFDREQHQREKIRRLETRLVALEQHRAKLERLLAGALVVAVGHTTCTVRELLDLLEELDDAGVRVGDLRQPGGWPDDGEPVVGDPVEAAA
jgi:hypothetical protein